MNIIEKLDKNISDFRRNTLKIDGFLTGTRISYSFFKSKYPELLDEFYEKERSNEEVEGLEILKQLDESVDDYEIEIFTFCFINLIARTEAFLNEILRTIIHWKGKGLSVAKTEKNILNFSHKSFKGKLIYLKEEFNLNFPTIQEHSLKLIEIYSTRNIILHNNGIVNKTYVKLNSKSKLKIGDKKSINEEYLKLTIVLLILVSKSIEDVLKSRINEASS